MEKWPSKQKSAERRRMMVKSWKVSGDAVPVSMHDDVCVFR